MRVLPFRRTTKWGFLHHYLRTQTPGSFFQALLQKYAIRTFSCVRRQDLGSVGTRVECIRKYMHLIKKRGLVSPAQLCSSTFFHIRLQIQCLPCHFLMASNVRTESLLATHRLKIRFAVKPLFRVVFPNTDLQEDVRGNACPRTLLVLQRSAIRLAICCVGCDIVPG